ncbi:MAG: GtrA family protein [Hyphomonas sp.]|nr:GtrA family protein [Hyphomonas sp.]
MTPLRKLLLALVAYGGLCLASLAYIWAFDWWALETLPRMGLGFPLAALGYGAVFWAMVAGFGYYFLRLGPLGRRVFLGAGAFLFGLLLCAWPGFYMSDSFAAVHQGAHLPVDKWLGHFTPILTHAVLQHVPFLAAVPFVQIAFLALGLAYAVETFARRGEWKAPAAILLAWVATSAPILHTSLLVTRDSWFAILSVFVLSEAIRLTRDPDWRNGKAAGRLLTLCSLAMLIRSDGILYVAFVATILVLRWILNRHGASVRSLSLFAARAFAPALVLALAAKALTIVALPGWADKQMYEVTLWVNPVAYIINQEDAEIDPADLARIDSVIPIELMDRDDVDAGIDAFWDAREQGRLHMPEAPSEQAALQAAARRIIQENPGLFIASRIAEFRETNYPVLEGAQTFPRQAHADSDYAHLTMVEWHRQPGYHGLIPGVRSAMDNAFAASTQSPLLKHQWAFWPEILMLCILVLCWRVAPDLGFAAALLAVRVPPLILLAPEGQFKYYAAIEMGTPVLMAIALPALAGWLFTAYRRGAFNRLPLFGLADKFLSATIARFGFVSLAGWAGDFLIFVSLTSIGVGALVANVVSAGAAVAFVYFASVRRIFSYRGRFIYSKFAAYAGYQVVAVLAASAAIAALAAAMGLAPWIAKIIVTPATFLANFLFMKLLTAEHRPPILTGSR